MAESVPRTVDIHEVDGIGFGSFSQIGLIRGSNFVVKIPFNEEYEHLDRELAVYHRLQRHSNILCCHGEVGIHSSERVQRGLLLDYHKAGTLEEALRNPVCETKRTRWAKQAIEAIRYIHSRGIIHGDVSCRNFLVANGDTLLLADFGGSRIDGAECLEFPPIRYTRPGRGRNVNEEDDLFGLGTVLYEIATSKQLDEDMTEIELKQRFETKQYPNTDNISPSLRGIIQDCWDGNHEKVMQGAKSHQFGSSSTTLSVLAAAILVVMALKFRGRTR